MAPLYGDRSLLELTPIKDVTALSVGDPVYFLGKYGFNRHRFGGFITLSGELNDTEYAVILHGDWSFDQLIPPGNMIAHVRVITNTLDLKAEDCMSDNNTKGTSTP